MTSRPELLPSWRIEPNLDAQVSIADASMTIVGVRLNLANEVKPLLDRTSTSRSSELQAQGAQRSVPRKVARREWAKMCRSIPLGAAAPACRICGSRFVPTRAFAAQPRIDRRALTLTIGVQAETRIVPNETKPDCPFPAQLELVPQLEQGRVNLAVPIDVPFTELNRLLEAQLKGKTFPEDKQRRVRGHRARRERGGVRRPAADLAARQGQRDQELVRSRRRGDRPRLGPAGARQRAPDAAPHRHRARCRVGGGLRHSGRGGARAVPYLERAVAESAVVDLNPLVQNARKSIEAAIADFRQAGDGVQVDAAVTALRLVGIAFDAKTLRVIAEADGTVRVAVTALPLQ